MHSNSISQLSRLLDSIPIGVLVLAQDLTVIFWNKLLTEWTGVPFEQVVGKPITDLYPDLGTSEFAGQMLPIFKGGSQVVFSSQLYPYLIPSTRADGRQRIEQTTVLPAVIDGDVYAVMSIQDVTDQMLTSLESELTEKALKESEERFRSILEHAPIGMAVVSLEGKYELVNQALCDILGYSKEELEKLTFQDITHPDDLKYDHANVQRLLDGMENSFSMEKRYFRKDRQIVWVQLTVSLVRDDAGLPKYLISQRQDITLRKLAEDRLLEANLKYKSLSITDGLTGIFNRRHFDEVLAREYSRHARSGAALSLILLDIDHFKAFNDTYGHIQGDDCLRKISRAIAKSVSRPADLVARYGGEEFVCVLPETNLRGAITIAERIRQAIIACAIPHETSGVAEFVTASAGVVTVKCAPEIPVEHILTNVDELLYLAKSRGRNRIEYNASPPMDEPSDTNLLQLVWKESFRCGNQLIDSQHQSLFHVSNDLLVTMVAERPKELIFDKINHFLECLTQHFRDEEQVLESLAFPDLNKHSLEHSNLHERLLELTSTFMEKPHSFDDIFHLVIHEVVMQHMLKTDREFFPYI